MACSGCGNVNCNGCSGSNVMGSGVILTPVECSTRPCSPSDSCSKPSPASPSPYYNCTPTCQEDHCQQVNVFNYQTAICVNYAFNIPACGQLANVYFTDLKVLPVGAYLWHATYGYFEVVAFNTQTGQVTLINNCNDGNAPVGTNIPACTCFVVTPQPLNDATSLLVPFVALDFVAPAVGNCIDIEVTTVAGLHVGDTITIGTGFYSVSALNTPTNITICNDGLGIVAGTNVIARNGADQLQYPINVISSCCTEIGSEIYSEEEAVEGSVDAEASSITTPSATLVFNNTSTARPMNAKTSMVVDYRAATSAAMTFRTEIEVSVDGAPFAVDSILTGQFHDATASTEQHVLNRVDTILPGATLTLAIRAKYTHVAGVSTVGILLTLKVDALAVTL